MILNIFNYKKQTFLLTFDHYSRNKVYYYNQKYSFSTLSIKISYTLLPPYYSFSSKTILCYNKSFSFLFRGMKSVGHAAKVIEATYANEAKTINQPQTSTATPMLDPSIKVPCDMITQPYKNLSPNANASSNKEDNLPSKPSTSFNTVNSPLQSQQNISDKINTNNTQAQTTNFSVDDKTKIEALKDSVTEAKTWSTYKNSTKNMPEDVLSSEAKQFKTYEDNGIVKYDNKGSVSLTREASLLHSASLPKPILRDTAETFESKPTPLKKMDAEFTSFIEKEFVAGTLIVEKQETEILSPVQSHIVVGERKENNIELFGTYTSDKGQQAGLAGFQTTTKLGDTQIDGNSKKAQYIRPISPPIVVEEEQFTEHVEATVYSNQPLVHEKLQTIQKQTERFKAVSYDGVGYTKEDLDNMLDLKNSMINNNLVKEVDDIQQTDE